MRITPRRARRRAVDGIHASHAKREVSGVMLGRCQPISSRGFRLSGRESGESGSEALKKRSHVVHGFELHVPHRPGPPTIQNGNILHAAGPNGGAMRGRQSIAGHVADSLEIVIRDIYGQASQGVTC